MLPLDLVADEAFADRVTAASVRWFADMRANLPGRVLSRPLDDMVAEAGLAAISSRVETVRWEPPLNEDQRAVEAGDIRRTRDQLDGYLEPADLAVLGELVDPDNSAGVARRGDAYLSHSRHIVFARKGDAS